MSLRTYTLLAALAAIIGLLVAIVPLLRSALEYRSPEIVEPQPELASLEAFVAAKSKNALAALTALRNRDRHEVDAKEHNLKVSPEKFFGLDDEADQWDAMYAAAKTQHIEGVRSKALRDSIAFGGLCLVSVIVLITHLTWARRLAKI